MTYFIAPVTLPIIFRPIITCCVSCQRQRVGAKTEQHAIHQWSGLVWLVVDKES